MHCIFNSLAFWLPRKILQRCPVGFAEVRGGKYLNAKIRNYCCSCNSDVWRGNSDYLGFSDIKNPFQGMMTEEE